MRNRTALKAILRCLPSALFAAALGAVALRLTLRDRVPGLAALTYAAPPPVLAALAATAGGLWLARKRWKPAALALAAAAAFSVWFVGASHIRRPPPPSPPPGGTIRAIVWNVARGSRGWQAVADRLGGWAPDVACLVEAGHASPERQRAFENAMPGYSQRWVVGGLAVLARGAVPDARMVSLAGRGRVAVVSVTVKGRDLTVVVVDIHPSPWRSRRPAFEALRDLIAPLKGSPLLVMGDFNTPRDSVFFDAMRGDLVHAFEAAGNGFDGTWPAPLPILCIDHVWCGRRLKPLACRLLGTGLSDHRAVEVEFAIE